MEISSFFFLFQSNILTFQRWQLGQCNSNEYHETCWDFILSFVFSCENNFVVDVEAFATQTIGKKKLVKSNKSISRKIFLTKFHFLQFQKWPKINY